MPDSAAGNVKEAISIVDLVTALREVVAEKSLLSSDWSHVKRRLGDLYGLATSPIRLTSPFPELCAYRLAHVMMRDAREQADFLHILELLQEPCGQPAFGSRPHLLRVAALHRLHLLDPNSVTEADIQKCFDTALDLACRPEERGIEIDAQAVTQHVTANLIEQTGYLLGLPFVGRIDPDFISSAVPEGKWTVLIRGLPMIWMTEPLARLFFEETLKRIRPAIEFEWSGYDPVLRLARTRLTGKNALISATLCLAEHDEDALGKAMGVEGVNSVASQLGGNEGRLNKHLSALRKKIAPLLEQRLTGADAIEGTLGAVNLRFNRELDCVGLFKKGAGPKTW